MPWSQKTSYIFLSPFLFFFFFFFLIPAELCQSPSIYTIYISVCLYPCTFICLSSCLYFPQSRSVAPSHSLSVCLAITSTLLLSPPTPPPTPPPPPPPLLSLCLCGAICLCLSLTVYLPLSLSPSLSLTYGIIHIFHLKRITNHPYIMSRSWGWVGGLVGVWRSVTQYYENSDKSVTGWCEWGFGKMVKLAWHNMWMTPIQSLLFSISFHLSLCIYSSMSLTSQTSLFLLLSLYLSLFIFLSLPTKAKKRRKHWRWKQRVKRRSTNK